MVLAYDRHHEHPSPRGKKKHEEKDIEMNEIVEKIKPKNEIGGKSQENSRDTEVQLKSKLLSLRLLKETRPIIREWENNNLKKGAIFERINSPEEALRFLNWARKEKGVDIEGSKKLTEIFEFMLDATPLHTPQENRAQVEPETIIDTESDDAENPILSGKLVREQTRADAWTEKIQSDPELSKALREWKDASEDVIGEILDETQIKEFVQWVRQEKKIDFSENDTAWELDLLLSSQEATKKIQQQDEEALEEISHTISRLPEHPPGFVPVEARRKMSLYQQRLKKEYGIELDLDGNPATDKDEKNIARMLQLADKDVQSVQRSGFFGKIKGFFQDTFASEKEKLNAIKFTKEFQEYTRLLVQTREPQYGDRLPVQRSVVRTTSTIDTGRGSLESSRYVPTRSEPAKPRGRPRKK